MASDVFLKTTKQLSTSTKHQNKRPLFALKYLPTRFDQNNITYYSSFSESCLQTGQFFTMQ
jgi:hypothetical protein